MNFHKTIGFLATLLLVFGLGVPDSYAQDVSTVSITLAPNSVFDTDDATDVTAQVTVTLAAMAESNMAVTVTVSNITDPDGADDDLATADFNIGTAEVADYAAITAFPIEVFFQAGEMSASNSGTFSFDPAPDGAGDADDETLVIQAATGENADEKTGTANLTIQEFISSITISLDMNSFVDTADATTVTAEVMVTLNEAPSADTEVVVTLTDITDPDGADGDLETAADNIGTAEAADFTFTAGDPITVTVEADATSGTAEGTFTFDPAPDTDDADDEMVVIQAANADAGQSVRANLTITELLSSVALALSPDDNFKEGTTTSVLAEATVTLAAMAESNMSVTVAVSDITDADGADDDVATTDDNIGTAEDGDYAAITAFNVVVNISEGAMSGTGRALFSFQPAADADNDSEVAVLEAAAAGHMGRANLGISEGEVEEVTITLSPSSVMEADGSTTVTAEVTVTLNSAVGAGTTVTVDVALRSAMGTAESGDYTIADLEDTEVVIDGNAVAPANMTSSVTVTFSIDPAQDGDTDDETVQITATAGGESGMADLTITDDGDSAGNIMISLSLDEIRENVRARDVVVTATLSEGTGPVTVMVTTMMTGTPEEITTATPTGTIEIAAGSASGSTTLSLDPSDDDVLTNRKIRVTGSAVADGYMSDSADITVLDDDNAIGDLTITAASPPSVTTGEATNVILTVKGLLFDKLEDDGTVVATLTTTLGSFQNTTNTNAAFVTVDPNNPMSAEVSIAMADHVDLIPDQDSPDGTRKITLTLTAADAATEGTMITVTASADMYNASERVIPVTTRSAFDLQGYRVVLVKPAANGWAIIGNDKVVVDVMRVGSVAYPWSQFESIKASVRDTAHDNSDPAHEIDAVTARNFNLEDNGSVTFEEPGSRSRGDVIWRGNDTIRFEIRIRPRDDSGTTDPARDGQYLGAYVHIEFTSGQASDSFTNRDSDKAVYPSNPTLVDEANRYRGDGKLFKVDNLAPSNSAITDVRVTSGSGDDEEVNSGITATVGDDIRVAIKVSGNVLFRDSGVRVQVRPVDGSGTAMGGVSYPAGDVAPQAKTVNFSAAQVIASTADSLRVSWTVNEGFFRFKTDNYVEGIGRQGVFFEPDEATGEVLVQVNDQAGNYSSVAFKKTFAIDSRSPGVTIRYPAADPDSIYDHAHPLRFTGHTSDDVHGYSEFLNPLVVEVDEDLSMLEVFAVGADTLDITDQFSSSSVGDSTVTYETYDLSSPKKDGEGDDDKYPGKAYVPSSANIAGTDIELAVLATDILGNTTKTTISGVTHDAAPPKLTDWFPKNRLLEEDQFNDATPPVFTLPEDVDSIAVRFTATGGADVIKERGGVTTKGEDSFDFSGELTDETSYDMTIFVRDLAGNIYITPADSSSGMRFNAEFDNPIATRYTFEAGMDSVIAGQANMLTIQAEDYDAGSDTKRMALTYKNMARISAWDTDGGAAESVWFEGTGVTDDADNPDGEAMLSAADWRIGKRTVTVKSNKATGFIKIMVEHLDSGMGDTAVVGFGSAIDSLYVGAADFAGFDITAWEEGVEGAAQEIWGDYTLRVVPVDRHGNPSVRAFAADFDDSLDVLDTRVGDSGAFEYKNGIDVEIIGVPAIEDFALLILSIGKDGETYDLVAPDNRRSQTVQVRVVNGSLKEGDTRSQNIRSTAKFKISAPLTPMLTLWVPGMEEDQAGKDVMIPADPGEITVTVAAEGYNAGDMVTFTRNGEDAGTVEADDDGVAKLMITASVASTTMVSATNGLYETGELTIVFDDTPPKPVRKQFVDANGDPVYLISAENMTVDVADFLALVAAFGSSEGDDNYNVQADVNDDGMVNVADFVEFITSFGKTAVGPATKPLVLLPGVNENAEFSLSLGSERVVAGETVAVDVSLANVAALVGYGFALNYESDKFEFVSVAPADEDLLKSTGGETLFHHVVADGQVTVANGLYNGTAISGGGDVVRFVFRVLREFEDNARFEIADGLVFDPGQLSNPAVVAGVLELQSTPREFALHQNFPNPFNPDTTIKYDLAESADVTLQIYNVLGQVVRTLVASEAQNAGRYQIRWNGMDDRGVPVSSGIYFYQISADGKFSDVRKLMLLK
ncbi:MAG: T9SS type A sorting domain-containing protein [Gemmatimonadales bacterium]|nr:T9SS type A sorting domain-containing protein [Gemmatimonadales bacterium]